MRQSHRLKYPSRDSQPDLPREDSISSANDNIPADLLKLFQKMSLDPNHYGEAYAHIKDVEKVLAKAAEKKQKADDMFEKILKISKVKPTWYEWLLTPTAKQAIKRYMDHMDAQRAREQLDKTTISGWFQDKFIQGNDVMAEMLSTRLGEVAFPVFLAGVGTIFPSVVAKKFLWTAAITNLASSGLENQLFRIKWPSNALASSGQWQASGLLAYYVQEAIDNSK